MNEHQPWRERFPILRHTNYLISNSLGAMPATVRDDAERYVSTWESRGVRAWAEEWWQLGLDFGDAVGSIFNAGPGETSMHLNVTSAVATVLSCYDWRDSRNGVVVTDMNFPSLLYLYREHEREGLRLRSVASPDGIGVDAEAVIEAIDETTRLVAVDHVLFRSAFIQDAKRIARAAHEKGALVLLDAFQSVGTVPVDVRELDVDFLVGGCLKWLCGGPGACFLWVHPDHAPHLEPRLTGWLAHADPFAFEVGGIRRRDDAYRFTTGTPNVPALYTARAGVDVIAEVGVEAIRETSMRHTARLVELADERGLKITAPREPQRRAGTVAVDVDHGKAVCQELLARDVIVDYRPEAGIRVSPHFYNTDEELDDFFEHLDDILETGAWKRHAESLPRYG